MAFIACRLLHSKGRQMNFLKNKGILYLIASLFSIGILIQDTDDALAKNWNLNKSDQQENSQKPDKTEQVPKKPKTKGIEKENKEGSTTQQKQSVVLTMPDWCSMLPTERDHLYACGIAKSNNLNFARRRALLDAKRQLADIINGRISSIMTEFVSSTNDSLNNEITEKSRMVTQNLIAETGLWGYEQIGSETEVIDRAYRHFILVRFPIGEAGMRLLGKIRNDDVLSGQTKAIQKLEKKYALD